MSVQVLPPSPISPLPAQGAKGEMRLTDAGVMAWDGREWLPADLFAAIIDDPTNFNRVNVATALNTRVVELGTSDAGEVVPGQLSAWPNGSGSARQPALALVPPIFSEADMSILSAALEMFGTSPDASQAPAIWLWTKQAGHLYIGVATDATSALNTYFGISDAHINLYANGNGSPSPGHEIDGVTGHRFVGAESHTGAETHGGGETHNGTEQHNGVTHFGLDVYFDWFTTFNQQETHQASEYHNGYENHTGVVQNNGSVRAGSGLSTGTGTVTAGTYSFVTITFGPTMNNTGVNLTLVGSLDTSTFVHYWSFTARTSTNFKVYATNWSDSTTYIGYQACALG